jgi:chromosome segregation ATPase
MASITAVDLITGEPTIQKVQFFLEAASQALKAVATTPTAFSDDLLQKIAKLEAELTKTMTTRDELQASLDSQQIKLVKAEEECQRLRSELEKHNETASKVQASLNAKTIALIAERDALVTKVSALENKLECATISANNQNDALASRLYNTEKILFAERETHNTTISLMQTKVAELVISKNSVIDILFAKLSAKGNNDAVKKD